MARHTDAAKEWGDLSARALKPLCIYYKPKTNSRTVQGDRNGAGERVTTEGQEGEGNEEGEGATGQEEVPDGSQADVSVHGLWKWGTYALFDMQIVNLYAGSYLRHTPAKDPETADKEKKDKYLQTCLERWSSFTPMVYSAYGNPGTESVVAHRYLAFLLNNKLKREYLEMCGFGRA